MKKGLSSVGRLTSFPDLNLPYFALFSDGFFLSCCHSRCIVSWVVLAESLGASAPLVFRCAGTKRLSGWCVAMCWSTDTSVISVPVDRKSQKAGSSSHPQIWSSSALQTDTGTHCCHCDTRVCPPTYTCRSVRDTHCHLSCRGDGLGTFSSMELQELEY